MNGTRTSQTLAIFFIPPNITIPTNTAITIPVIQVGTLKVSYTIDDTELACTIHPIPNAAMDVNKAKSAPPHFDLSPCSRTYIGPPAIVPSLVLTRYLTDS